ncbi:MAG: DUF456 domain-containing protein [Nocardioides sp.]
MTGLEIVVALAILVGLVGIIVPVLPGAVLVLVAILVWASELGTSTGWIVFAVATVFLVVGAVAKYVLPGRRLKGTGIPSSTQWTGVAFGVVGFFVVPVIGLFLGFVLGMYVAELRRVGAAAAVPSTRAALAAVGLSVLIELVSTLLAASTWAVGVVLT